MRGHGQPGLLDNLRTFSDLIDDTGGSRRPFVDYTPGLQITSWTRHSGDIYKATVIQVHDGMFRDIVGVDTPAGALVRVESVATLTFGTFFTTIATALVAPVHWDDGVTRWDDGVTLWDAYPEVSYPPLEVYVRLFGDSDPRTTTVVALLGFYFGTRGEVYVTPIGTNRLTNGDSDTVAWGEEVLTGSGFSSGPDAVLFKSGLLSTKLASDGSGGVGGSATRRESSISVIAGGRYAFAGYYRTDVDWPSNLTARILIGDTGATTFLYPDGRDLDASGQVVLTPTIGEWRAFWFDFVAPFATIRLSVQIISGTPAAGQLNIDRMSLRPIRYVLYEPRLAEESLPEAEVASQSIFFGGKTRGLGTIGLLNGDGVLERAFSQLLLNKPATTYVGGTFGVDGQELSRDDWRAQWLGIVQQVEADDSRVTFETEDARNVGDVQLPPRSVSRVEFPNCAEADDGAPRWMVFLNLADSTTDCMFRPPRVDKAGDYGVYELADCTDSAGAGLDATALPALVSYDSEEAAKKNINPLPLNAVAGADYTYDQTTGRVTIINDVRDYWARIVDEDVWFDFDIGGATLTFPLTPGTIPANDKRTATGFAAHIQSAMRGQAGVVDIFVSYDHTIHKFLVQRAGTLNLRMTTGPNKDRQGWGLLGFSNGTDRVGPIQNHWGDFSTFTGVDKDHVICCRTSGYRDDDAGSITGTPFLVLAKYAWMAKYVLNRVLGIPLTSTDLASFQAGAAADASRVRALIGETISASEFLSRCEVAAQADLVVGGDGVWRWRPYSLATVVREFFDRDFLSFKIVTDLQNVYRTARVRYAENPAADSDLTVEMVHDPGIRTKYGRGQVLERTAYIGRALAAVPGNLDYDAGLLAIRLAKLAAANPRVVEFAARGKMVDLLIGDKINITRTRAFDPAGSFTAKTLRVTTLRHNHISGVSRCTAVEDVPFT
jgi:hypothetical protein